jgi:hypothetical protein
MNSEKNGISTTSGPTSLLQKNHLALASAVVDNNKRLWEPWEGKKK